MKPPTLPTKVEESISPPKLNYLLFHSTSLKKHTNTHTCTHRLKKNGPVKIIPQGAYGEQLTGFQTFQHNHSFYFKHGGVIPKMEIAYETWGELNKERNNAILLHTGLSASSHAKSHKVNHL